MQKSERKKGSLVWPHIDSAHLRDAASLGDSRGKPIYLEWVCPDSDKKHIDPGETAANLGDLEAANN